MIVGVGIDTVEVPEFRASLSDSRIRECFLPDELAYASSRARPWESLAARFAAKRATLRALGLDGDQLLRDVEIVRPESGGVGLRLAGRALDAAAAAGVAVSHVSITHSRTGATAVVLLEGRDAGRDASASSAARGRSSPRGDGKEEV